MSIYSEDYQGPGCYAIFHENENKVYIGSSKNITNRRLKHFNDLKKGRHSNFALQYDYDNDKNPFTFVILDKVGNRVELRERECEFMEEYLDKGYLLYNSNLSCQSDVPYFMVKPTAYETNYDEESLDDIAALEVSIKNLRAENIKLMEDNKELSHECTNLKVEVGNLKSNSLLGEESTIDNLTFCLNSLEFSIEDMLRLLEVDEELYTRSIDTFCDMVNTDLDYIEMSIHNHYVEDYRNRGFIDKLIGWWRPSPVIINELIKPRKFKERYPKNHMNFMESITRNIEEMKSLLSGEENDD